jgi:hypothetical protein
MPRYQSISSALQAGRALARQAKADAKLELLHVPPPPAPTPKSREAPAAAAASLDAVDALPLGAVLLAWPVSHALNTLPAARSPSGLFVLALLVLSAVLVLPRLAAPMAARPGFHALFTLFAFTSAIDGLMSLTAYGSTNISEFYLHGGEAYLRSSHGAAINAWDATGHLACYLVFAWAARRGGATLRAPWLAPLTFAWAGSVLNSLAVLLPGIFLGKFAERVQASVLLNALYVAVPVAWCAAVAAEAPRQKRTAVGNSREPTAAALALLCGAAAASCVASGLAAAGAPAARPLLLAEPYLADDAAFPRLQAVLLATALAPMLVCAALALAHVSMGPAGAGSRWLRANAALLCFAAGAALQAQLSYVAGSLIPCQSCEPDPTWRAPAPDALVRLVARSLLVVAAPALAAWFAAGE